MSEPSVTIATKPDPLLAGPHDTCVRCGRPTPVGVSLCEEDNPGRIRGPSATQMHGTIFIGVVVGFVLLAAAARYSVAGIGPFEARLESANVGSGGAIEVVLAVTNSGTREAISTCRLTRDGLPRDDDPVFRTEPIPSGQTRSYTRTIEQPAPPALPFAIGRVVPLCR
jgi:hypothetical protein